MISWTPFSKSLPACVAVILFLVLNGWTEESFSWPVHASIGSAKDAGSLNAPLLRQSTDTIAAGSAFRVGADYAQGEVPAVSLRLYQNDVAVHTVPVSSSVEFPYPDGLPSGTYVLRVVAVSADGTESCADGACANPVLTLTVTAQCSYILSASNSDVPSGASTVQVILSTQVGCAWLASSSAAWLSVSPANGQGSATLSIAVQANTATGSRAGVVTVQGQTYTVTQAGVPAPALAVGYTLRGCTGIVTASAPPDTRTGWGIQFRKHNADGTFTSIGSRDTTVPYQRNPGELLPGTHTFSGVWTRTGSPSVTTQTVTKVCD